MDNPTPEKLALYQKQKGLLDTFLEKGAISKAQYNTSLSGLQTKLGIKPKDDKTEK